MALQCVERLVGHCVLRRCQCLSPQDSKPVWSFWAGQSFEREIDVANPTQPVSRGILFVCFLEDCTLFELSLVQKCLIDRDQLSSRVKSLGGAPSDCVTAYPVKRPMCVPLDGEGNVY